MSTAELFIGERYLLQTNDKKLALTTHRLIKRRLPFTKALYESVMLEDITGWEIRKAANNVYVALCFCTALFTFVYTSFYLLSAFFLILWLFTNKPRLHVKTLGGVMVLPVEVEGLRAKNLQAMVSEAQSNRRAMSEKDHALVA